jgi:hypothetical protein
LNDDTSGGDSNSLTPDDLFIKNDASTVHVVFLPLENGVQQKKSCKKGNSKKEESTIDGFRKPDGTLICVKDCKVLPLRHFCSKNEIFNHKTGNKVWNDNKFELIQSIENHIQKTARGENPYAAFENSAAFKKNPTSSTKKSPKQSKDKKNTGVVNRITLANVCTDDEVVVLIQEHRGKTLKVRGELDEGQKTDQKLFEIIADRYNNTNNKKADGTSINEYHLWGITEMAMTSNLDPSKNITPINWMQAKASFRQCLQEVEAGLSNWRKSGTGDDLETTTFSFPDTANPSHKDIKDFIQSADMLYWYYKMKPLGEDVFKDYTGYVEPREGKGSGSGREWNKKQSRKKPTNNSSANILAAAQTRIALAEEKKADVFATSAALENEIKMQQELERLQKRKRDIRREEIGDGKRFPDDPSYRRSSKKFKARHKELQQTPGSADSEATNVSFHTEMLRIEESIIIRSKQVKAITKKNNT